MRHTVQLLVDELPGALARTARLLEKTSYHVERLIIANAPGSSQARLTAVVRAPADARVLEHFAEAVDPRISPSVSGGRRVPSAECRVPSTRVPSNNNPFHWQADGAGDDRVG